MDFQRDSPQRASNATEEAPERAQGDPATVSHEDYVRAVYRNDQFPQPLFDSPPRSNGTATSADSPRLERRGDVRYKCDGSAEFRTEGVEMRTWARVTDISRTGCYVEMQATSPLHTTVNLLIEVEGIRVRTKGEVTTCYPLLGMGIAFKETLDADAEQLQRLLSRLESGEKRQRLNQMSRRICMPLIYF